MSIEVQQLCKVYGEQVAVNNISFTAAKGLITGFLGPNGAGKSTTMKMLTGFVAPTSGLARIGEIEVSENPKAAKQLIGYLPESNALYPEMYVKEYLSFCGSIYKTPKLQKRIVEVIAQVGLHSESTKKIGQLSKGYKQRVGLAAAILHNPEVLILDEPTSGLDPNQIIEIRQVIKNLGREKTILLSSHIMQEVEAICDHVIIIHQGNIVANDTIQNVRKGNSNSGLRLVLQEVLEVAWFLRLPSVLAADKIDSHTWQIQTHDTSLTRKEIMQLAIEHDLNIESLLEGTSLESLFRQLTTDTNIAPQ